MNPDDLRPGRDDDVHSGARPDALSPELRRLRADVPPDRDLWPGIAARLEPRRATAAADLPRNGHAPAHASRRRGHQRRNAGYAAAAAVVVAAGVAWQMTGLEPAPPAVPGAAPQQLSVPAASDANAPLLRAADALAREYQGALREVAAASGGRTGLAPTASIDGLDAELERRATEVRAALARDPDAIHLLRRLQDIYAHRLALSLRQA